MDSGRVALGFECCIRGFKHDFLTWGVLHGSWALERDLVRVFRLLASPSCVIFVPGVQITQSMLLVFVFILIFWNCFPLLISDLCTLCMNIMFRLCVEFSPIFPLLSFSCLVQLSCICVQGKLALYFLDLFFFPPFVSWICYDICGSMVVRHTVQLGSPS